MATKYIMRAFKISSPIGFVFWTVQDTPDLTGSQSPYSPSELQNITINSSHENKTPVSNIQFAGLIENPAGVPTFQLITTDMIQPPFVVTLSGGTNLEVNQTITNPTFSASYSGGTPVSATLTNNFDSYTLAGVSPFTSFVTSHSWQRTSFGQSVTFTLTANNGTVNKTGTTTYTWLQKAYYGVGSAGQSSSGFITGLASQPITGGRAISFTVNPSNQKIYYAHRTAYGLASPTDFIVGGFAGGFTNTATVSITNAFGFTENYYLYESDNLLSGSTTVTVQ